MLDLRSIAVGYGNHEIVKDLSLHLDQGEIGCLLGASGCGKTTILRAIAGFEPLRQGEILLAGNSVARPGTGLPPEARRVGVVFQDYALFPHLTVHDNIAFGLRHLSGRQRRERVGDMLALVGLQATAKRYPHELSGGQQQRVALARSLAPEPQLMLMDEPFSNLDVTLRERLAEEVRDILKQAGATAILVTHDQREAFAVADKVGVMAEGKLLQWDTPFALYHHPSDRYVASFIGEGVLLPAQLGQDRCFESELGRLRPCCRPAENGHSAFDVLIRPDAIVFDPSGPIQAKVVARAFRGAEFLYTLELPSGGRILALAPSRTPHELDSTVSLRLLPGEATGFPGLA